MTDHIRRASTSGAATRSILLRSASAAVLVAILGTATPAYAQLAARTGSTLTAPTIAPRAVPGQVRSPDAVDALARQAAARSRADQIRTYATEARAAAARSTADGLQGLVVANGVNAASLASGALQAARDSTGRMTWQGASLPVDTADGSNRLVVITQTDSRAILSWDRFDVGASTTLRFDQQLNGVAQRDWVAVNRVVDPNAAPSQILGRIKADGTVVIVNRNGVIFGNGAQVSANSLLASSLDIGNFLKAASRTVLGTTPGTTGIENGFIGTTLQDRNLAFLQNGLLQSGVGFGAEALSGQLVSADLNGFFTYAQIASAPALTTPPNSEVIVERGASITAGTGGFVILTGPRVSNDGTLRAAEGQVSLQAGQAITHTVSTGSGNSVDPNIRGIILRTPYAGVNSSARNSGLIETNRGYASLGAGLEGRVSNAGLIAATTSVSRNGSIELTGGTVILEGDDNPAHASGLVILPDTNGETIPQGTAANPASFKTSQIRIGGAYIDPAAAAGETAGILGPAAITIGENALILAPSANVEIGGKAGDVFSSNTFISTNIGFPRSGSIDIAAGALIDISGVKDVTVEASRNSLLIDPVKRNELRDTPNYRETNTNGEFTLNGATVYVDPRVTGVRDDGVAYVGSPLIESGSAASQIGVTAAELMTKGGTLSLNVSVLQQQTDLALTPGITIAEDATIDFSGGWVRYLPGIVRTSRLLTVDGRIVDIGRADPNDRFVAIGDGFTQTQSNFGISRTYGNSILQGARFEEGYDEGRDAGAVIISASRLELDGTLHGNAFPGIRQLSGAHRPSTESPIPGDLRNLQAWPSELPSGGYLRIGAFDRTNRDELIGDIVLGDGTVNLPTGAIRLDDTMLTAAGLSALSLRTSGAVDFTADSSLTLANGGALRIEAGRSVNLDGTVRAPSGSITISTIDLGVNNGASGPSTGSPFRSDDNLLATYTAAPDLDPFDINVGGVLSTAGLWVNDLTGETFGGSAWSDGGSISLTVAPSVFKGIADSTGALVSAADLSGSIYIDENALLDVSSGGYVAPDGTLELTGGGGDVALVNATRYASILLTDTTADGAGRADESLGGINQTVTFTPYSDGSIRVVPSLVPDRPDSEVSFSASSIKGFGFAGGGIFRLVAPDIAMGSDPGSSGPRIGLDFLQRTGFGTLDLTAFKSRLVAGLFNNGQAGNSAFLETERFVIGEGETLDLTQTVLPSIFDAATLSSLTGLATGSDIKTVLTPGIPADAWDRRAANLRLGGLTELEVAEGGSLTGAAGATITVPRLYNAGTIRIAGGSIVQFDALESILTGGRVLGVRDAEFGGSGLSDVLGGGTAGQTSGFDENALAAADVFRDAQQTRRLTNGQLFSLVDPAVGGRLDVNLVFTGRVALNEGIRLAAGSITDLSGTAIYNSRAPFLANGKQQQLGRLVGGGSIQTSNSGSVLAATGYLGPINPSNKLVAEAGSTINLNGASGAFDQRTSSTSFERVAQWSNAGRLTIGNGALLTGANLTAFGGDDGDADRSTTRATGGIIDWVAPTIRQADDGSANAGEALFATQIMDAGFASVIARNGFTVAGDVALELGKSFVATTDTLQGDRTGTDLVITAAPGANASITAPYVRLASSDVTAAATLRSSDAGHIAFHAQAIDVVGSATFNVSNSADGTNPGSVTLEASGDIRLIGTAGLLASSDPLFRPILSGQLVSNGDLLFRAGQVYATTGTGNLQQLLEDRRAGIAGRPDPYVIASSNINGLVRFDGQGGTTPATPLSAGSYLRVLGANIEQNGVLRAPLGLLEIGSTQISSLAPATMALRFGTDSLTSVSARTSATGDDALSVPYGTTTDLIEYFFSPGTNRVLSTVPVGELRLAGRDITIASDDGTEVRVDARGGGDVFAFEFIPGTGGSRDVLDRFNADSFSSNDGLQFPDGRQVYAILPANSPAAAALYDPIYSADYSGGGGVDLYGLNVGLSVTLDAAPGLPAGEYLLLPAHYALLPGALRIVENTGAGAPFAGAATTLLDGSYVVGGTFSTAGTGLAESQRRSFTVQTREVFSQYSRIETTSGSQNVANLATVRRQSLPLLPRDAARVVLSPLTSLRVAGAFATNPALGGLGAQFDIGGSQIRIAAPGAVEETATADYVLLTTDTLASFNANSLSIGALRSNNLDGTTTLDVVTRDIRVDNDVVFSAPELLLAVGGPGALLSFEDAAAGASGARLTAAGTLNDSRTGDFIINATAPSGGSPSLIDQTGAGALVRLATGSERLVTRQGDFALRNSTIPARLEIGQGTSLAAAAITLDSSRTFAIDRTARIGEAVAGAGFTLAVSGDALRIGGLTFHADVEAQFGQARTLTYRSPDVITFAPGQYNYNNLTIDAAGIALMQPAPLTAQTNDLSLVADHVVLRNSSADAGACVDAGPRLCSATSALTIDARDITFGGGIFRTYGFDGGLSGTGVTLTAREGMFISGVGGFNTANLDENIETPLNLITPFIVDRMAADVRSDFVRPDFEFTSVGAITVRGPATPSMLPTGSEAPGTRIAFTAGSAFNGIPSDIVIDNALVRATAGRVDVNAIGSIFLTGNASIQTPGYIRTFDDGIDRTVVSAGGGVINLITRGGGSVIDTAATSSLIVDNGVGEAGTLNISASQGEVNLRSLLNPGVAAGIARSASLRLDTGFSAFDLAGFVAANGLHFQGDIAIHSGAGNLDLLQGQSLVADSVSLTADGGSVVIAGSIDTSGDNVANLALTDPAYQRARIDGGDITLFGQNGVSLTSTASLAAKTSGYGAQDGRQASGGDVTIGIGTGTGAAIDLASGATIDFSALRPGSRLISEFVTDPVSRLETTVYRIAQGDRGGLLSLRAPLLSNGTIAIGLGATVSGAREKSIEAYRRFDLDAIAAGGAFAGVAYLDAFPASYITLNASEAGSIGRPNFLADLATGTLPDFIRNFSVSDPNSAYGGYRIRPGVELNSANDIRLLSNWNLAAGQIVNADGSPGYRDALEAGLLVLSPLGPDASGQPRYEVVAGKEAELFENFIDMSYRVGGLVRGEAPILTLRAAGNLEIRNSINDGFFAFHDLTNAAFINYQLGGGDRSYNPALIVACGVADASSCSDSISFADAPVGPTAGPSGTRVTIQIGNAQQGDSSTPAFINAPYNPLANTVAAGGTGDPLGVAELFPLFSDGSAAHSTSLNFVAGAMENSANPLQLDFTKTGSVVISGEKSFEITGQRGTARIAGTLQLGLGPTIAERDYFGLDELLDQIDGGSNPELNADYYTVLNWGIGSTGAAAAARDAALAYFPSQASGNFLGSRTNPTGVAARLRDVIAFLRDSGFAQTFSSGVEQQLPGFGSVTNLLVPQTRLRNDTAYVGTTVRTGDGTINVSAVRDIDLRGSAGIVNRSSPLGLSGGSAQIGGTALYTAGVRVAPADLFGGQFPVTAATPAGFIPGNHPLVTAPVFAKEGGEIQLFAGRDILGRRDVWTELFGETGSALFGGANDGGNTINLAGNYGAIGENIGSQLWRYGIATFAATQSAIAPNYFTSGVGALSGGDVSIRAGRDVSDLTIALDNSLAIGEVDDIRTLMNFGGGDLLVTAGRNVNGGQFDIASGSASVRAGADIDAAGTVVLAGNFDDRNLLRVRVSDATARLFAGGSITLGGLGALGTGSQSSAFGFFSSLAGVSAQAAGDISIVGNRRDQMILSGESSRGYVLPPSLALASFSGDIVFGTETRLFDPRVLYPSRFGQLSLLAGGDIANFGLAMSDVSPTNFFGSDDLELLQFPVVLSDTSDTALRALHNRRITHLNNFDPVRIVAGGSIRDVALSLPKQARISAGQDIIDLAFQGQNVRPGDVTRITAGGDITGSTAVSPTGLSAVLGNSIVLGGPGALFVEAGRNLGPFITSATGTVRTEAGGIRTIGNEANPWLPTQGASIFALFGVGNGADYAALESTYLNPANFAALDGDLFVQVQDALGNGTPDRDRYNYAPVLAEWLRDNQPALFVSVFGTTAPTGAELKSQSYARYADLYAAFAGLDQLTRNRFLIDKLYFGELAAPSDPNSPSFEQFVRGYRAVQTLFSPSLGYTDNLAVYDTDPATITVDHPLGVAVRRLVDGQPAVADQIDTGSIDLRLSTIQTARGGDITILGPGGNFVAGSVVRTEAQINRREAVLPISTSTIEVTDLVRGNVRTDDNDFDEIVAIPQGLEGILTLRGGEIRGFTDGSFVLNQSRLFTQAGGDITLWSSNGDLNAGQGPRNASSFPPIVLRFSPNGSSEVDSAGSVSGAGIGAFRSTLDAEPSAVRLIAPAGTVDAGDAGVRASGDVFVAAARVANADNFAAGGSVSGVPSIAAPAAPAVPASAAAAVAANAFRAADAVGEAANRASRIFVDVLGYFGGETSCPEGQQPDANGQCVAN